MTGQKVDVEKVGFAIQKWVAQHNRRDEGIGTRQRDIYVEREERGLRVTQHDTIHYLYENGPMDATAGHCVVKFNSTIVYEKAGSNVTVFIPGEWIEILFER